MAKAGKTENAESRGAERDAEVDPKQAEGLKTEPADDAPKAGKADAGADPETAKAIAALDAKLDEFKGSILKQIGDVSGVQETLSSVKQTMEKHQSKPLAEILDILKRDKPADVAKAQAHGWDKLLAASDLLPFGDLV
jgi:hypothetical protein